MLTRGHREEGRKYVRKVSQILQAVPHLPLCVPKRHLKDGPGFSEVLPEIYRISPRAFPELFPELCRSC